RIAALVQQMTLDEKIGQMQHNAPAIERLGIPAYNWWNECLHGVGRAGKATVFPQAIGLAASWNTELLHQVADVISTEARAKHHDALRHDEHGIYQGLTFWSPNINIVRDPRWGRAQETYGEDPYLTARLAVAFVRGLQGEGEFLKVAACAKHYAVHSGPEALRHTFDAKVSEYDLWDTYLPAFEACVREAQVESVMGAYTRTNGEPCCASPRLLVDILRGRWAFDGHVVSDCGAIDDLVRGHRTAEDSAQAAAQAVIAGCDLECGITYHALDEAVTRGLIDERFIDQAITRLLRTRFRLGMFDPPNAVSFASIPMSVVGADAHRALARRMAQESIVLLKNDGVLPLAFDTRTIAVIGPNADALAVQLGNYNGDPVAPVTVLAGIQQAAPHAQIRFERGCDVIRDTGIDAAFNAAVEAASQSEVILFVGGLSQILEGEESQQEGVPAGTTSQGDRSSIELPIVQDRLLQALGALNKPLIVVLMGGSAIAATWAADHANALLLSWYPGEAGEAVADVLFGTVDPSGRLPITIYRATDDLPPFDSYDMTGRTYRYFNGDALYPFGYGLSYTRFTFSDLHVTPAAAGVHVSLIVENVGERAGTEVFQVYTSYQGAAYRAPRRSLCAFRKLTLEAGKRQAVEFDLPSSAFSLVNEAGEREVMTGEWRILISGGDAAHTFIEASV
ncbi:MAG: glycoside hydrolase family 3 C-terminal domain-containing protein, partial [Chloroflexota bacterium]|nr:glycoside hydrolase family 3 C-terminal domain-containing protein [Chloroflexota bacterium]